MPTTSHERLECIRQFIQDELERRQQAALPKTDPYMAEVRKALADVTKLIHEAAGPKDGTVQTAIAEEIRETAYVCTET